MGKQRDYQSGLYNELEKLNKKLDSLLKENKNLSIIIYNSNLEIKSLNDQLDKANELTKKLTEENEKLKN